MMIRKSLILIMGYMIAFTYETDNIGKKSEILMNDNEIQNRLESIPMFLLKDMFDKRTNQTIKVKIPLAGCTVS